MLPIRDNVRSRSLPWVNYLLVTANIFAFVFEVSLGETQLQAFVNTFGLTPARYPDLLSIAQHPTALFTSMFLHGGVGHLASNLLYLYIFGDNVEDWLGHTRYVFFYLFCGIAAGLGQYMVDTTSTVPMVGASGAISGVLGAYLLLYPRARLVTVWWFLIFVRFIELPAVLYLGVWFLMQLGSGMMAPATGAAGGVAIWAHIAGFLAGMGTIHLFGPQGSNRRG